MQLHYNVIWIDDEIKKIKDVGDLTRVNDFISDLGFAPNIIALKDGKEIDNYFNSTKFDLIISDLSIEEGHHGDDIIRHIRSKKIFTEVLFYSSQNDLKTIAEKLLAVDRISFHAGRRDLVEKIENLISLSVSKLLELNATRGLITSETSELDVSIEDVVMDLVYSKLKSSKEEIDAIISYYVDDFLKKTPEKFMKNYSMDGFKSSFTKIEANRKWGIFRDLLKQIPTLEVKAFLDSNKTYGEDVITVRNKFAHAKAIEKGGKLYLAGFGPDGKQFEFNESQCIAIRKKLIEHRNHFNALLDHLKTITEFKKKN